MKIIKKKIIQASPSKSEPVKTDKAKLRIAPKIAVAIKPDALTKARAERQLRRDAGEVDKRRNPKEAWEDDKKSMRKAINANCFDCCGEENYTKRIRYCDLFKCSFWMLRPYSKGISQKDCLDWHEVSKISNEEEVNE